MNNTSGGTFNVHGIDIKERVIDKGMRGGDPAEELRNTLQTAYTKQLDKLSEENKILK